MYDKFCKGLYYLFSKFLFPFLLLVAAILAVIGVPTAIFIEIFGFALKKALLFTAISWGTLFLLIALTKAIDHGEKLVRAEKNVKKGSVKNG